MVKYYQCPICKNIFIAKNEEVIECNHDLDIYNDCKTKTKEVIEIGV